LDADHARPADGGQIKRQPPEIRMAKKYQKTEYESGLAPGNGSKTQAASKNTPFEGKSAPETHQAILVILLIKIVLNNKEAGRLKKIKNSLDNQIVHGV
jgi:hypothetical protein